MSRDYAMSRVRDALEKSEGNHLKAQRLLLTWLEKDQNLLLGLVAPHLQGIISHAINHIGMPDTGKKSAAVPKKVAVPKDAGEFGQALLSSMKGGTSTFGQSENLAPVSRPGAASQKHIDTMHALASASKNKTPPKKK